MNCSFCRWQDAEHRKKVKTKHLMEDNNYVLLYFVACVETNWVEIQSANLKERLLLYFCAVSETRKGALEWKYENTTWESPDCVFHPSMKPMTSFLPFYLFFLSCSDFPTLKSSISLVDSRNLDSCVNGMKIPWFFSTNLVFIAFFLFLWFSAPLWLLHLL